MTKQNIHSNVFTMCFPFYQLYPTITKNKYKKNILIGQTRSQNYYIDVNLKLDFILNFITLHFRFNLFRNYLLLEIKVCCFSFMVLKKLNKLKHNINKFK